MASVNFLKCKGSQGAALMRHCDTWERLEHEHSNPDINKDRTPENVMLGLWSEGSTYEEALERYKSRIAELDASTNHNRRRDRVSLFALETACPAGMEKDQAVSWCKDVYMLIQRRFKARNVVCGYIHVDEIHEYLDHGEVKESRVHIHTFVVPEIGGTLNGKAFSSKAAMQGLNKEIDSMTRDVYHCPFLTGEGEAARQRSVEELKEQSEMEAVQEATRELERERCDFIEAMQLCGQVLGVYDSDHRMDLQEWFKQAQNRDAADALESIMHSEAYMRVVREAQRKRDFERKKRQQLEWDFDR